MISQITFATNLYKHDFCLANWISSAFLQDSLKTYHQLLILSGENTNLKKPIALSSDFHPLNMPNPYCHSFIVILLETGTEARLFIFLASSAENTLAHHWPMKSPLTITRIQHQYEHSREESGLEKGRRGMLNISKFACATICTSIQCNNKTTTRLLMFLASLRG